MVATSCTATLISLSLEYMTTTNDSFISYKESSTIDISYETEVEEFTVNVTRELPLA